MVVLGKRTSAVARCYADGVYGENVDSALEEPDEDEYDVT